MKTISIEKLEIRNFKGIKSLDIDFTQNTNIFGRNAAGKSTIVDSITWLLFNCDSQYRTTFAVRPLDSEGNQIHNIDISVTGTFVVNGESIELKKVSKEIWTKHRGNENATFEGNKNTYEILGYPKSEKDYKAFISENIGDIEVFKMLIDPRYFVSLDWKKQRAILMTFYKDITDTELAGKSEEFTLLVPELKVATVDDIKNKYAKAVKEFKNLQKEIPIRIDELNNSKVDYDLAELNSKKAELVTELNVLESGSKVDNSSKIADLEKKIAVIDSEIETTKKQLTLSYDLQKADLQKKLFEIENDISEVDMKIRFINRSVESKNNELEMWLSKKAEVSQEYIKTKKLEFDENSTVCNVCGQKYPDDKISEIKANFESKKNYLIQKLTDEGFECKHKSELCAKELAEFGDDIVNLESKKETILMKKTDVESKISSLVPVDIDNNSEIKQLQANRQALVDEVNNLKAKEIEASNNVSETRSKIIDLKFEIENISKKISQAENNSSIDERIKGLNDELFDIGNKLASQEKMLYILENFIKYKLDFISDEINKHFKTVNFILFKTLINGGMQETCECEINGVPYSNLNTGHKLIAGLDIIKALSEIYDINSMIFLDNAECLSENNIPKLDSQLITLSVSNDKDIIVR